MKNIVILILLFCGQVYGAQSDGSSNYPTHWDREGHKEGGYSLPYIELLFPFPNEAYNDKEILDIPNLFEWTNGYCITVYDIDTKSVPGYFLLKFRQTNENGSGECSNYSSRQEVAYLFKKGKLKHPLIGVYIAFDGYGLEFSGKLVKWEKFGKKVLLKSNYTQSGSGNFYWERYDLLPDPESDDIKIISEVKP